MNNPNFFTGVAMGLRVRHPPVIHRLDVTSLERVGEVGLLSDANAGLGHLLRRASGGMIVK